MWLASGVGAQPPQSRVGLAVGGGLVLLLAVLVAVLAQTGDGEGPTTPAATAGTTATTAPPFGGEVRSSGAITIDGDALR